MHTVTTFSASAAEPEQVGAITAEYLALERVRIYRRLLTTRFGLLAVIVMGVASSIRWPPPIASWFSVGVCLVAPAWVWVIERKCARRLARRLHEAGGRVTHIGPGVA